MNKFSISLVISSRNVFDVNFVTEKLRTKPTEIWKRRPGVVVHGVDNIPLLSWIYEETSEGLYAEEAITDFLDNIKMATENIEEVATSVCGEASIVCRVITLDPLYDFDLSINLLKKLASISVRLLCSVELSQN